MKTIRYILASIIAVTMYACTDNKFDEGNSVNGVRIVAEVAQTRTAYVEENGVTHVTWKADDAVGIFTSTQSNLKYKATKDGASTEFTAVGEKVDVKDGDIVFAYYPYSAYATNGVINENYHNITSSQSISDYDYMYASGVVKDGKVSLQFQHVLAFLKITLRPSDLGECGVLRILGDLKTKISGNKFLIEDNELVPKCDYFESNYEFNENRRLETEETSIYMPIAPIDGKIELTFYCFKPTGEFDRILFYKETPEEGLLAGHIYNLSATNEIEEHIKQLEYTSTDYSKDGEVFKVQSATVGNGINLVFMGDGFVDKDMESGGLYEERIKEAVDNYFSYEPLKSFRNRFNVYGVKVVSKNNLWKEGVVDHRINENINTAIEYASKVGSGNDEPRFVTVVYNVEANKSAGRSYTVIFSDGSYVGYVMERDASVLSHEVCGHGFGQLLDEYVEGGYENISPTDEEKSGFDAELEVYGWGANVDWRSDLETIRWARFIKDSRYAGENLGAYEGAATYGKGMYRPTENSMMRSDNAPFNAPSREQIYKNIMKRSEGSSWTYDYEKFVEYDAINRTYNTRSGVTAAPTKADIERFRKHHRAPVYVKGTWRNMMKSNRSSYNGPLR